MADWIYRGAGIYEGVPAVPLDSVCRDIRLLAEAADAATDEQTELYYREERARRIKELKVILGIP